MSIIIIIHKNLIIIMLLVVKEELSMSTVWKEYSRKDQLVHIENVHNDESCCAKGRFECPFSCTSSTFRTMSVLL